MLKIVVPTDFSMNSGKGMKFAIQWATQQKAELIFIFILYIPKFPQWKNNEYEEYAAKEELLTNDRLNKFVHNVYRSAAVKPQRFTCVVRQGISADLSIMEYCRKVADIDYICMATRGAGKFNKLFGTNTGNLITKSGVPVVAVPRNYRKNTIRNILYATNFDGFYLEIKKVMDFAHAVQARITIVHLAFPNEVRAEEAIYKTFGKKQTKGMELKIIPANIVNTLYQNLEIEINKLHPSLVIMFTHRNKNFLQKMIIPSSAENLSFETNVPLLVYPKGT